MQEMPVVVSGLLPNFILPLNEGNVPQGQNEKTKRSSESRNSIENYIGTYEPKHVRERIP
ncbi:MAG: hypothetical protein GY820_47190 [Gammaproteobacteria bacterium]|nr:hypothetical protein [Gammaproteobacteria bacterium]